MSPLESKIREIIAREGPIPFARFMSLALYEPELGYYMRTRSPFGKEGDFFTASQLQPVFGRYVFRLAQHWMPTVDCLIDLGAGREDLRDHLGEITYSPIQPGGTIPKTNQAVLFANEFFDALPVDLYQGTTLLRVGLEENRLKWHPEPPKSGVLEQRPLARSWLEQAWAAIGNGFFLIVDYGYRHSERMRFPEGSLMSYRRHIAMADVLSDPGEKDISAHVDWDSLIRDANEVGWVLRSFESVNRSLLSLGSPLLEELGSLNPAQLKTLLLSFGDSFEVLILEKPMLDPAPRQASA